MPVSTNCCVAAPTQCIGCRTAADLAQTPPSTIQVVIQGTTLCTTLVDISGPIGGLGSGLLIAKVLSGTLDGVYCCNLQPPSVSGQCVWLATLPSPVVVQDISGGFPVTITTLRVVAVKNGTFGGYPNNYDSYPQLWPPDAYISGFFGGATSSGSPQTVPMNFMVTCDTNFVGPGTMLYTVGLFTAISSGYPNCINGNALPNISTVCGVREWYWLGTNASQGQGHLGYLATGGTARVTMDQCVCEGASTISATISGVSLCACATNTAGGFCGFNPPETLHDARSTGTAPNGTYCLTKTFSSTGICQYSATVPSITGIVYTSTDGTCTSACYSSVFDTLTVTVNYTNNVATHLDIRITNSATTSANVVTLWAAATISSASGAIDGTYTAFTTSCGATTNGSLAGYTFASGGAIAITVNGC